MRAKSANAARSQEFVGSPPSSGPAGPPSPEGEGSDCRKSFLLPRRRKAVLGVLIRRIEDLRKAGGFLRTKSSETGRAVSVHALPHGIANSFRQTIPRMVCLRCLLTSLGERFAFRFLRGPAPAPPQPFEKGWRKLYVLLPVRCAVKLTRPFPQMQTPRQLLSSRAAPVPV